MAAILNFTSSLRDIEEAANLTVATNHTLQALLSVLGQVNSTQLDAQGERLLNSSQQLLEEAMAGRARVWGEFFLLNI